GGGGVSWVGGGGGGRGAGGVVASIPLVPEVISCPPNRPAGSTYRPYPFTVASPQATEERTVDETGQPGADATPGGNGAGERGGPYDSTPWPANGSSSPGALAGWRHSGGSSRQTAVGSARVHGDNTSIRPRAAMRAPYADLLPSARVNVDQHRRAGQPRYGAEVDDHPINGSARPLT